MKDKTIDKAVSLKNYALRASKLMRSCQTGAYAAQAAYFFVLSLIPIVLLLLTMVQFTPVTKANILDALGLVFPTTVQGMIENIVTQVYAQSRSVIPLTIIVALWSAGKGVLSITSGLNNIYDNTETRNYFFLRIRASFYTVLFVLAIMLSLILSVFGNSIQHIIVQHIPVLTHIVDLIIQVRTVFTFVILTLFWDMVYKFLPNRKEMARTTMRKQFPGAVFTAIGWMLVSFVFSIYLNVFQGFATMYGSLTTIILFMLWLYFCMYVILLGGLLNAMIEEYERSEVAS